MKKITITTTSDTFDIVTDDINAVEIMNNLNTMDPEDTIFTNIDWVVRKDIKTYIMEDYIG